MAQRSTSSYQNQRHQNIYHYLTESKITLFLDDFHQSLQFLIIKDFSQSDFLISLPTSASKWVGEADQLLKKYKATFILIFILIITVVVIPIMDQLCFVGESFCRAGRRYLRDSEEAQQVGNLNKYCHLNHYHHHHHQQYLNHQSDCGHYHRHHHNRDICGIRKRRSKLATL